MKKYFPAISSALSPEYLIKLLIDKYALSQNTTCKVLRLGINHTYEITAVQHKYILRVYSFKWRTAEEIKAELDLLNLLKSKGILVSYPIKDKNGHYIQSINAIEGERFAVLFSYANGEKVQNLSEKACYHFGIAMAKMHQITVDQKINRITYDADTLVKEVFNSAKKYFASSLVEMQYIRRANAIIASQFSQADSNMLRYGIIHLDLWYDNMKIQHESEMTMFDFDNCGNGWLFLDIAYGIMLLFKSEPDKEIFKQKAHQFYKGYQSIAPISEEEKRLIPYGGLAIWLHYTGIHIKRFDDFTHHFLNEAFLKYWIDTVNNWMEYNDIKI